MRLVRFPLVAVTFDGRSIYLTELRWLHIVGRHPEVGEDPSLVMKVVERPSEIYSDRKGGMHLLRPIDNRHFLVAIYEIQNGEGYIKTAYVIDVRRKLRRYGKLQPVRRS